MEYGIQVLWGDANVRPYSDAAKRGVWIDYFPLEVITSMTDGD
jgi:hypothetical protein